MTVKPEHKPHLLNLAFGGLLRTVTPDDVAEHLVNTGYAQHATGGLIATEKAHRMLIEQGHKPSMWK